MGCPGSDWAVNRDEENETKKREDKKKNTTQNRRRSEWDPINFVVSLWLSEKMQTQLAPDPGSPASPHHCVVAKSCRPLVCLRLRDRDRPLKM